MFKFFKSYRGLWEKQNQEIDQMTVKHNKEVEEKNKKMQELEDKLNTSLNTIQEKNEEVTSLKRTIGLFEDISQSNRKIMQDFASECKNIFESNSDSFVNLSNQIYSDYKEQVKKIGASRGGLQTQFNKLQKRNQELIVENDNLRKLILRISFETKKKLTPPTIKELQNYKLFGNKEGKKDGKIKNN